MGCSSSKATAEITQQNKTPEPQVLSKTQVKSQQAWTASDAPKQQTEPSTKSNGSGSDRSQGASQRSSPTPRLDAQKRGASTNKATDLIVPPPKTPEPAQVQPQQLPGTIDSEEKTATLNPPKAASQPAAVAISSPDPVTPKKEQKQSDAEKDKHPFQSPMPPPQPQSQTNGTQSQQQCPATPNAVQAVSKDECGPSPAVVKQAPAQSQVKSATKSKAPAEQLSFFIPWERPVLGGTAGLGKKSPLKESASNATAAASTNTESKGEQKTAAVRKMPDFDRLMGKTKKPTAATAAVATPGKENTETQTQAGTEEKQPSATTTGDSPAKSSTTTERPTTSAGKRAAMNRNLPAVRAGKLQPLGARPTTPLKAVKAHSDVAEMIRRDKAKRKEAQGQQPEKAFDLVLKTPASAPQPQPST